MKKLALFATALALLGGCATTQIPAPKVPVLVNNNGITTAVLMLNEQDAVVIVGPENACAKNGRGTGSANGLLLPGAFGTLMYYTGANKEYKSAVWSNGMPAPQSMPAWTAGYGTEICKWYNTTVAP